MSTFQIIAILVSLAAAFSYINFKFLKLPNTVGVMLALITSLILIGTGRRCRSARTAICSSRPPTVSSSFPSACRA